MSELYSRTRHILPNFTVVDIMNAPLLWNTHTYSFQISVRRPLLFRTFLLRIYFWTYNILMDSSCHFGQLIDKHLDTNFVKTIGAILRQIYVFWVVFLWWSEKEHFLQQYYDFYENEGICRCNFFKWHNISSTFNLNSNMC